MRLKHVHVYMISLECLRDTIVMSILRMNTQSMALGIPHIVT
ncbi:hypothetical protein ES703_39198 [subsurface metagenome]